MGLLSLVNSQAFLNSLLFAVSFKTAFLASLLHFMQFCNETLNNFSFFLNQLLNSNKQSDNPNSPQRQWPRNEYQITIIKAVIEQL